MAVHGLLRLGREHALCALHVALIAVLHQHVGPLLPGRVEGEAAVAGGLLELALLDVVGDGGAVEGGGVALEDLAAVVALPAHSVLHVLQVL